MKKYPGTGISFVPCEIYRVQPEKEGDEVEYEIKLSDETEMERSVFGVRYREIIDHGAKSIDLTRLETGRAAFLYEHDPKDQIGVLHSPRIQGRALYAKVRWSSRPHAQEIRGMVDEGVRLNISQGMQQKQVKLVEENEEKGDLYRVMRWEPFEASSVAIGNNINAVFTRYTEGGEAHQIPVEVITDDPPKKLHGGQRAMKNVRTDSGGVIEVADDDPRVALTSEEFERYRGAEIHKLCELHGYSGLAAQYIDSRMTIADVGLDILNRRRTLGQPVKPPAEQVDPLKAMGRKERSEYSYLKAIREAADDKLSGVELEVHTELRRHQDGLGLYGRVDRGRGIMLPTDLRTDEQRLQQYTLASNAAGKGAETVFDRPGEIIELLRNQAAVIRLGARFLSGLTSPIAFPKQTGPMTASWVGENPVSAVSATDLALGLVTLSPRWLQATTSVSRQLLLQSSIDVEAMVRRDLAAIHALAIDRAAIHGQAGGATSEPKGVYVWPDVQQKAMAGAVDYIELTQMIGLVADKNAVMGAPGWLTTPLMAAKWLATLDFAAAAAGLAIWQGTIDTDGPGGRVAGYRAYSSGQVSKTMTGTAGAVVGGSDHGIIFGNWDDMIIGTFGALEIIVDPYTLADKGLIKLTSFQGADVIVRHGESFCVATGGTLA